MSVFVITQAFDCEGESPVAVAVSLAGAKLIADAQAIERGYESGTWEWLPGPKRHQLNYGSTQWLIREEEVQGYEPDCCESMAKYGRCGA